MTPDLAAQKHYNADGKFRVAFQYRDGNTHVREFSGLRLDTSFTTTSGATFMLARMRGPTGAGAGGIGEAIYLEVKA